MKLFQGRNEASFVSHLSVILITICMYRFGTGVRTEKADAKVPGAGTYHPNLIETNPKPHTDMPKSKRFEQGLHQKA